MNKFNVCRVHFSNWHKISTQWCDHAQLYLTLFDPMDYNLPGSSVYGDSPGKNTGMGCNALLQGIFPTQGQNSLQYKQLSSLQWIVLIVVNLIQRRGPDMVS